MQRTHGRGFTLIELLVTIAIIAILIALLVPAVQKVRDAAARAQCANNMRQIGLAVHQYHDLQKVLPSGMQSSRSKQPYRLSSWLMHILPYLDQQNLWATTQAAYKQSASPFKNPPHVGLATAIPVFVCPADSRVSQAQVSLKTKTLAAFTSYLGVSGKDLTTLNGVFFRDSRVRLSDISDGTSNTLLFGERPPSADFQFGWWYAGAGQRFTGSADMLLGVFEQNVQRVTVGSCAPGSYPFSPGNVNNQCDMFHFWSLHSGGAHFVYADASVHFLSYSAAPIMSALASRAGGETVEVP
jgi:prepilin-type N-terminal cleavage/methylation domain-containing protein